MSERSPNSKFSDADILAIRGLEGKVRARTAADLYDVGVETIRKIWRRETFRHVGKEADSKILDQGRRDLSSPLDQEPPDEAALASARRLSALLAEESGKDANNLLKEIGGEG